MPASTSLDIKPSLTLERRIKAPAAKVWAAWTDPAHVMRWMGPRDVEMLNAECDCRVGGRFRFVMLADSGEEHDVSGVYREVVRNKKLVFTWTWRSTPERESLVTVLLKPDGDETHLTLLHEQFCDEAARDRHATGWGGALDKLVELYA